ncbi:hypothetical protein ACQCVO_08410 [Bacillus infantis]|uniref:hypothetical protein n=1 Tax=Bacillus infantis TaxID=324767 RepID=UPI003CE994C2
MAAKTSGTTNKRLEDHIFFRNFRRKLMNSPRYRAQKSGRIVVDYDEHDVSVEVLDKAAALEEEYFNQPKEGAPLKPVENKLTKAEKRELAMKLAGSAKHFSYDGLKETDRISNREEWEEDVD